MSGRSGELAGESGGKNPPKRSRVGVGGSYSYTRTTPWGGGRTAQLTERWESGGRTEERTGTPVLGSLGKLVERTIGVNDRWAYDAVGLLVREELASLPARS